MNTRDLRLTHEEIELLTNALQYVYDQKIDIVKTNRKTLGDEGSKMIVDIANKYFDLQEQINNSQKDV